MNNREACVAYFKEKKEYRRIFLAMRKKWESMGRVAGKVTLFPVSVEERIAIERFLGRAMQPDKIVFSMQEFEEALQETRYENITLTELLEGYFGEKLISNQDKKVNEKNREQEFFKKVERKLLRKGKEFEEAVCWIREMQEGKNSGYGIVMKEYRKSEETAEKLLLQISACLNFCNRAKGTEGDFTVHGVRLAVLAANIWGNPHALDRQTIAGTLLSCGLCRRLNCDFPQNAQAWKSLYEKNGILVDVLSSMVITYGIHLKTKDGLHPAYEGYLERKEPCVITLANLTDIEGAYGESDTIFIVENEMVFSELVERCGEYSISLLCTSGQPRTAAYQLMELLAKENCTFFYAGDLDPEGLDIAERIWRNFPTRVKIWRMGEEDYKKSMSAERISQRRLEILKHLSHPELLKTAKQIRIKGRAGYQELLLEDMVRDIAAFF